MKIEQQLRETIRMQGLSEKTFDAYWHWVRQFLLFAREKRGQWVHPSELRERQVEIWLKHLANDLDVSANTQNQAFSALCYLYRHVIRQPLEGVSALRAKRPDRICGKNGFFGDLFGGRINRDVSIGHKNRSTLSDQHGKR